MAVVNDAGSDFLDIADTGDNLVRQVNLSSGIITTVAGGGSNGLSSGGPATAVGLGNPVGVAVDGQGDLYIAEPWSNVICKVDASGNIATAAGNGSWNSGYQGVTVDTQGDVFIADPSANAVYEVAPGGSPTTVASVADPQALAVDAGGDLFIAQSNVVSEVKAGSNQAVVVAGNGGWGGNSDADYAGPATGVSLNNTSGLAVTTDGNGNTLLFIADTGDNVIREVNLATGTISTVAGGGSNYGTDGLGDGGPANLASLSNPQGLAVDGQGDLFIADTNNHVIREVGTNGIITTVAGGGVENDSSDQGNGGPASAAYLVGPEGVARSMRRGTSSSPTTGMASARWSRPPAISSASPMVPKTIPTAAVGATPGADWPAAQLSNAAGLALDGNGNLYIADPGDQRVAEIASGALAAGGP